MSKKVNVRAIPAGVRVTVRTPDGYKASGRFVGLVHDGHVAMARVISNDGLERRVPAAGLRVAVEA